MFRSARSAVVCAMFEETPALIWLARGSWHDADWHHSHRRRFISETRQCVRCTENPRSDLSTSPRLTALLLHNIVYSIEFIRKWLIPLILWLYACDLDASRSLLYFYIILFYFVFLRLFFRLFVSRITQKVTGEFSLIYGGGKTWDKRQFEGNVNLNQNPFRTFPFLHIYNMWNSSTSLFPLKSFCCADLKLFKLFLKFYYTWPVSVLCWWFHPSFALTNKPSGSFIISNDVEQERPGPSTGPIKRRTPGFNTEQRKVCDPGMEWIFVRTSHFSD